MPLVRATGRGRVPVRRPGARRVPQRSRGALRPGVGRLSVHARQPSGTFSGALVPRARLPAVVQRRTRHSEPSVRGDLPNRRGAAGVTSRRLPEGGSWIDRSKPLAFRFDGMDYEGFEGDTLASALLANGVIGGFRSPILGRPRGVMTAGPGEAKAVVKGGEAWFEAVV